MPVLELSLSRLPNKVFLSVTVTKTEFLQNHINLISDENKEKYQFGDNLLI